MAYEYFSVKTTTRRFNEIDLGYVDSFPWELSDDGLANKIRRVEKTLKDLEAAKVDAIKKRDFDEAKKFRRDIEPLRLKLYDLMIEEEFRKGH